MKGRNAQRPWLCAVTILLTGMCRAGASEATKVALPVPQFACVLSPSVPPKDQGFRVLPFAEFIGDVSESLRLPLKVAIPVNYELAKLPSERPDYSYWMPPEKVKTVLESGDLPVDTGYFYSKISLDVAYDADKKLFVGFEDRDPAAEMKQHGGENLEWERVDLRGYPAIFYRIQNASTKRVHYNAYIATLYEGIVFYIAYTPPDGDSTGGAKTWGRFRTALTGER